MTCMDCHKQPAQAAKTMCEQCEAEQRRKLHEGRDRVNYENRRASK